MSPGDLGDGDGLSTCALRAARRPQPALSVPQDAASSGTVYAMTLPLPAGDRPVVRASGPGDIVQIIPYVLGFHPSESVVLMGMHERRVVLSARHDLDAPIELVEPFCDAARKAGADRVVAVVYTEGNDDTAGGDDPDATDAGSPPFTPLPMDEYVLDLKALFREKRLHIVDVVLVRDGRWWSYQCPDPWCCPVEGTPIDPTGAVAVAAVAEGLVALPDRDSLERELATDRVAVGAVMLEIEKVLDELDASADASEVTGWDDEVGDNVDMDQYFQQQYSLRAARWHEVRTFVRGARKGNEITYEVAARVLWALSDRSVRDASIGFLARDRPEPELRDAWRQLARMAPPMLRPAPATLFAMWCYAAGDGARANVGIDAALEADPDYTLAHLVLDMLFAGIPPSEIMREMGNQAQLVGRRIQRKRDPAGRRRRP